MRIVFAGTPEFAVPCLAELIKSKHEVVAVFTQPDRPSGRGQKLKWSPVKEFAVDHDLPVSQPVTFKDELQLHNLAHFQPDLMVVVAYGLILPLSVLKTPKLGCINVHASLLPRWRGASPIQYAILSGDHETGITIMQMNKGMDTGDILFQSKIKIETDDTSATLHDRLAQCGAQALMTVLSDFKKYSSHREQQDATQVTYSHKIQKSDAQLDWNQSAKELSRKIRAFNPWPIAYGHWRKKILRIWQAIPLELKTKNSPGIIENIHPQGLDVATGEGILRLKQVQLSGGKPITIQEFINGLHQPILVGRDKFYIEKLIEHEKNDE